jgi:hypothetical protein
MVTAPRLVVCADDLGMCADIDAGIFAAVDAGTVSQASWMAPGRSAHSAALEARARQLPCGLHLTFAAEWDLVRWPSLAGHAALHAGDGNLPLHPSHLRNAPHALLLDEGRRQVRRGLRQLGRLTHLDSHVALVSEALVAELGAEFGLRSRDPLPSYPERTLPIGRLLSLTNQPPKEKVDILIRFARARCYGLSVVICHPAVDGPALNSLCSDELAGRKPWSRD